MKKLFSTLLIATISASLYSQKVGINTTQPLETLDVRGTGYFSDKLGLGVTSPQFPLSFFAAVGLPKSITPNAGVGVFHQPNCLKALSSNNANSSARVQVRNKCDSPLRVPRNGTSISDEDTHHGIRYYLSLCNQNAMT